MNPPHTQKKEGERKKNEHQIFSSFVLIQFSFFLRLINLNYISFPIRSTLHIGTYNVGFFSFFVYSFYTWIGLYRYCTFPVNLSFDSVHVCRCSFPPHAANSVYSIRENRCNSLIVYFPFGLASYFILFLAFFFLLFPLLLTLLLRLWVLISFSLSLCLFQQSGH